jgi:hypothetical protein
MLLPTLTANATRGDVARLRRVLRLALAALGGLGALGVLASFAAGSWAVRVLFGAHVPLPGTMLEALAVGTVTHRSRNRSCGSPDWVTSRAGGDVGALMVVSRAGLRCRPAMCCSNWGYGGS